MGEELSVAPAPLPWQEQYWAARLEKTIERRRESPPFRPSRRGILQGEL